MITIDYQTFGNKGFQLRLRLYQSGETRFINVTKLLKGNIQKRHWNQKKQLFVPSCPFSEENNSILVQFKQKYDEMAINWSGSVFRMIASMEEQQASGSVTVQGFIQFIVDEMCEHKHDDGTIKGSFEGYIKCDRRLQEFCKSRKIQYSRLLISEITPTFVNNVFDWVKHSRKGSGMSYLWFIRHFE